ncbi:MAG: TlpA family protein disulfide reductase [Acidimicrobiia bacterium]
MAALALVASACRAAPEDRTTLVAHYASFEVVTGRPQRVLVGLSSSGGRLVAFGTVHFAFSYLGTRELHLPSPQHRGEATAEFRPIPGQGAEHPPAGPRLVPPSVARGVYGTDDARFDTAGFWRATVTATIGGRKRQAEAAFEVLDRPRLPAPGDPAPLVPNPLPGAPGVAARSIDSRAEGEGPLPDPELHAATVADAIAQGRPTMVVVSTPTYCTSRFCGPITDSVAALARRFGERMAFVHLEVWEDFDAQRLNGAAAAWIYPPGAEDAREPWVFTVDPRGVIVDRFDNVATDAELAAAVRRLLG